MSGDGPYEFKPDWCLAPAACLREWLNETSLSVGALAVAAVGRANRDRAAALIQGVLDREPLTEECALILARGTGISAQFWLNFEHNYRAGLAAGLTDVTPEDEHA